MALQAHGSMRSQDPELHLVFPRGPWKLPQWTKLGNSLMQNDAEISGRAGKCHCSGRAHSHQPSVKSFLRIFAVPTRNVPTACGYCRYFADHGLFTNQVDITCSDLSRVYRSPFLVPVPKSNTVPILQKTENDNCVTA